MATGGDEYALARLRPDHRGRATFWDEQTRSSERLALEALRVALVGPPNE